MSRLLTGAVILTALSMMGTTAWAQDCVTDLDCAEGFLCGEVGASSCASAPCREGDDCGAPPECETQVEYACIPAPCQSANDCGPDQVCLSVVIDDCGDMPTCAPGSQCEEPAFVPCTERTESYCVPRYLAPCETNADCGEGFTCVPDEACSCSGSSGAPIPEDSEREFVPEEEPGEEPMPIPDPACDCEPTGHNFCQLNEMSCNADTPCPDGWSCESAPVTCRDTPGEEPICDEPEQLCQPPYWFGWDHGGEGFYDVMEDTTGADNFEAGQRIEELDRNTSGCNAAPLAPSRGALFLLLPLAILALRRR